MRTSYDNGGIRTLQSLRDISFQREVAQLQAKALLRELTAEPPDYEWTYIAQRVIRNAVLGTLTLQNLARQAPSHIDEWSDVARRLAFLWESLGELQESTSVDTALLNAAINYELAGYHANAAQMIRRLGEPNIEDRRPTSLDMSKLFLQRRLLWLRSMSAESQVEPEDTGEFDAQYVEYLATAILGSAFSKAAQFFLQGDQNTLEGADADLETAEQLLSSLSLVEESNLTRSIRSLLPIMKARSTWTLLPQLAPDRPKWRRYLKLLARGVGADLLKGSSISELWPSQIAALEQGLLDAESSKVVRMPTSAGKTRIAEIAIVHTLVSNPGAKCVYVAPYRALVSELQQSFLGLLSDLGYRSSTVTGTYESDDFEDLLLRDTDVLITTPEKLDLVLRSQPEILRDARLFVLDEAQIVHESQRGIKFEILVTRLKGNLPAARFLVLSAVLPQQTLEDFASWFNASPQENILTSKWRPSVQRYARLQWTGKVGVLRYAPAPEEEVAVLEDFVPGVIRKQTFEYTNPTTHRRNRTKFPDTSKAQIAAELAYKFAELGPVLVFCSQTNFVDSVAKALKERLDLAHLTGENLPSYFEGGSENRSSMLADEWLGDQSIVSLLRSGIGVHYGPLPQAVRGAIETDFRQRKLRVLIATNTLAQGVNLPVRTVVVHSCWRHIEGQQQRISARDYWNAAGRAGRAGEETEGLVVHIDSGKRDETDFQYYLERRQDVEPVESALLQRLVDLVQERMSKEALKAELDPEILSLLVEESSEEDVEAMVQDLLGETLFRVQASRNPQLSQRAVSDLNNIFVETANDIVREVAIPERRKVYSSTGLSTASCQTIRNHAESNRVIVQDLLTNGSVDRLSEIVDVMLPLSLNLTEMQSSREISGSHSELLMRWVQGVPVKELLQQFGGENNSSEELGRFIDDVFSYRLPWVVSAYVRIARDLLEVEHSDLSEYTKFLPSMIKYGLPTVEACWALSIGIPSRRAAIRISATYMNEAQEISYEGFLEWLGEIDSDRLYYDFGFADPLFEDISTAIFTSATNGLLRPLETIDEFLPHETDLRRMQYENRYLSALRAKPESSLELVRDYDDTIDRNAVAVNLAGRQIGYLSRSTGQIIAPEMDTGSQFTATVVSVERTQIPTVRIRVDRA